MRTIQQGQFDAVQLFSNVTFFSAMACYMSQGISRTIRISNEVFAKLRENFTDSDHSWDTYFRRTLGLPKIKHYAMDGIEKSFKELRIYNIWKLMIRRCCNPKHERYMHYGGRGIRVCDRWMRFELFYADMGERPEGLTLDRIDPDGNYSPENCTWATPKEQSNNKSSFIHDPLENFG